MNVLSLKDDDLADEGDDQIKPGSGVYILCFIFYTFYSHDVYG